MWVRPGPTPLKRLSGRLRPYLTNIRLGWKGLRETSTLAYYENPQITAEKGFIGLAPGWSCRWSVSVCQLKTNKLLTGRRLHLADWASRRQKMKCQYCNSFSDCFLYIRVDIHKISYKFLTIFLQFSYKFLTNFLQFSYKFLTNFLQISYKFLTNFLQSSYELFTNFLQISNELLTNFLQSLYNLLMNFLWTCYELLMNFLWTSYDFLMNFLWTSYELLMKFLWTSYELLENFSLMSYTLLTKLFINL